MAAISTSVQQGNQAIINMARPQMNEAIRKLCAKNFLVFQKVELGLEIGAHHRLWAEQLMSRRDICDMAPRDHGKSVSLARAYPIWRAKYDPFCTDIILLGADQASAVENLDKLKVYLTQRDTLKHLVPRDRVDGMNSRTEVRLTNGTHIKAIGYRSPIRGRHPQLIVLDDVLNERNSLTPIHREETRVYFYEVIFPMKDKGMPVQRKKGHYSQVVVIGTSQDREDLYHELLVNPGFIGLKLRSCNEETEQVLWPERYSFDDLMTIKGTVGSLRFSKEYQNEPLSDDTTIFPPSLFEPLKDKNLSYVHASPQNGLATYMGVDFSVPGSFDGDWPYL